MLVSSAVTRQVQQVHRLGSHDEEGAVLNLNTQLIFDQNFQEVINPLLDRPEKIQRAPTLAHQTFATAGSFWPKDRPRPPTRQSR